MTQVSRARADFDVLVHKVCDDIDALSRYVTEGVITQDEWKSCVKANDLLYDLTEAGKEEIPYGN